MTNLDSIFKSRDITLPTKVHLVKAMVFPSGHVWMWELDCEEGWVPKNWCFWTVVLEKTLESALDCKEIQPVHSEGDQPWDFFGRNDAEAETRVLWPCHAKSWLIGKDADAGRDSGQDEKGMTEDEMAGWHHRLDGWEFEQAPGVGDGPGSLACRSPRDHKESDTTEQLDDWTELNWTEWLRIHPDIQGWNLFSAWVISLITCLLSRVLSRSWDCLAQESIRQHPKSEEKTQQRSLQEKKCTDNESVLKMLLDVQPSSGHETTTYFASQFK